MRQFSLFSLLLPFILFSSIASASQAGVSAEQKTPSAEQKSVAVSSTAKSTAQININTATAEEMAKTLDGIGINKAKRIIEYRDKFGPFVSIEQIKEVSGIGNGTLAKNIEKLTL